MRTDEQAIQNGAARPRFAVSMRGYNRTQVDSFIGDSARSAAEAQERIGDLEARLSELEGTEAPKRVRDEAERTIEVGRRALDQFAEQVDAKASQLEDAVMRQVQPQLDEVRHHVEELEEDRRSVLAELAKLRESLDSLARSNSGDSARPAEPEGAPVPAEGVEESSPTDEGVPSDGDL